MNITLPLRFLKPVKISIPKLCKIVTQTEKVKIVVAEDKQYISIDPGAIVMVSTIDSNDDMVLMIWHMINDEVCEVDFGVKIKKI